jgi:exodeoxyribonuclease V alpha subunit
VTVADLGNVDRREEVDRYDVRLAHAARGILRDFNDAGVLAAADVHVARRLALLGGERDPGVVLAAALAVRAPRLGHVHVDLGTIRATAAVESADAGSDGASQDAGLDALPWPEPEAWRAAVAASPLVAVEAATGDVGPAETARPFRLAGHRLYLERMWADERAVADALLGMSGRVVGDADGQVGELAARLFDDERQRHAAETVVRRGVTVIAGGPGTGKTTTVARTLALLFATARLRGLREPLVALAAPTGKAAARLTEAVHGEARKLPVDVEVREALLALEAVTLHRLLGRRRDSDSRFRHDRTRALPHDVIVVDETSMVALSFMARLLEAVRRRTRLVLVGDPGQLASIEAGAVLGDIVGPAAVPVAFDAPAVGGQLQLAAPAPADGRLSESIVVLTRVHRFGGAIATLADAVRRGDPDATLAALERGGQDVEWIPHDTPADAVGAEGEPVLRAVVTAAEATVRAAHAGDGAGALAALAGFRLLCAHRRGPYGVSGWSARVLSRLAAAIAGFDAEARWYLGRPLLVTENDYELGLFNGDTGVVVARPDGGASAVFARRGEVIGHSPTRLGAVDTVYAMTIHKSQGSQFATAAVVLPPPGSRLLSRELLYTALTRAEQRLIVAGSPESVRAAVERPVARASGLGQRLWEASRG